MPSYWYFIYVIKQYHKIIKEGATLIHSVEDILNEYQIDRNYYTENSKKYDNIKLNEKYSDNVPKNIMKRVKEELTKYI